MSEPLIGAIECVVAYAAQTGESPTWSSTEQALYWIDIDQPALHRFDPASGRDSHWMLPDQVGCFAVDARGTRAWVALRSGLFELTLASGALEQLAPPPFDPEWFRFNEGGCDSEGRFWLGTMFEPKAGATEPEREDHSPLRAPWHSYTRREGFVAHPDLAIIPNGLAWNGDYGTMYLAHSKHGTIYAFDFDVRAGRFSNQRLFAAVPPELGVPDGGAVDSEGCYWSALHGGGRLRRFRPDGTFDFDITLPVSRPTKCTFGGPALDTVYVTSASGKMTADERRREPWAGRLLRFRSRVRGRDTGNLGLPTRSTSARSLR